MISTMMVEGIEAKGKNGYFVVDNVEVCRFDNGDIYIEIYSKRRGDVPPIRIMGKYPQMRQFMRKLFDDVTKV